MLSFVIAKVLGFLSSGALDRVFSYLEKKTDSEIERKRIENLRDQHAMSVQADVIKTGMSHNWFWIPWLIATVPLSLWFGYGMVNTIFPSLPHIAEIPPGLLEWAQIAWGNLFYSGGGVAAATILGKAISSK